MSRARTLVRVLFAVAILVVSLAAARTTSAQNMKHHITLGLGYQKYLGENLKDDASGLDFTNAATAALDYRFSLKPSLDVTLDLVGAASKDDVGGVDLTLTTSYFGPGIRFNGRGEGTHPFVQANVYLVDEEIELEQGGFKVSSSESGVGFGLSAGIDIRASRLLSIPIQAAFNYGEPADVLRSIGGSVGLTFNFGELR
jgi:hypothetical protein